MTFTPTMACLAGAAALSAVGFQTPPTFKAGIEAVRVDVSVTERGVPVRNLTAANFVVTDNGAPQAITSVSAEKLPLRIVLALDTSGSVDGAPLAALVDASRALLEALHDADRIALVTFSGQVTVASRFEASRSSMAAALATVKAGGATALYDALQAAIELSRVAVDERSARPLVLAYSDGIDTGSWLHEGALLEAVRRGGVVVHAIMPTPRPRERIAVSIGAGTLAWFTPEGKDFMTELPRLSGGRLWTVDPKGEVKGAFLQSLSEMRDRYLLAFTPQTPARAGWHELKVTLKNARGDVLARPGYYVEQWGTS